MNKKLPLLAVIVFLMSAGTVFSQNTWVEKMQDPNINFYDVQKSFNQYYKYKEAEHRREERREQEERAKKMAKTKTPAVPVKGGSLLLPGENEEEELAGGWEIFKRWESYMAPRLYPSGDRSVMINAWNDYLDSYYASSGPMRGPSTGGTPTTSAANWTLIGPTTSIPTGGGGAGRVNFIRFDPTTTNTIYIGSPGGGLWKSTNAGVTWTTGTDNLAVIGTTDLAIHPTNPLIQYLATGDGEAQDTYSIGVLKTTNGGTSWSPTGLSWLVTNGRTISRLLINPQNPNTLFAATSNGVYRTLNAGTSWTQIATAVANMKDIEYRPGDTTIVYATSTTTFYRSTNGGTSFTTTATGLPTAASCSRLSVAVTAANNTYVYVLAANTAYGLQGLYRSTDNGVTFTARSTTPNILGYSNTGATAGGQGWYDLALAVSPANQDQVMVGGVNIWRSINGGTSWTLNAEWTGTGAPYVHADCHALEYLPASTTTYFAGCDGGLFKTSNTGTAWSDLSNGLQISEAYRLGLSTTNQNMLLTGWQDNGTNRWSGTATWSRPLGGDGMEAIIDWSNANIQYGELYYGSINKTTTGGNLTTNIVASGGTGVNADGDWVTPYIEAPSNAATLWVGKAQVYKSTNSGTTWAQVGTISGGTGNVIALANAASNINYVYAAKIDKFYACTTGAAFVDRTAGLPTASAAISYICVDPLNANRVWVTFSGYSAANKVWYSPDAGVTWSNYSTGLPNLPANCIVYQGSASNDPLYVGTDVGVYYRDNLSGSWTSYNTGLPNVSVRELEIQYTALKLRAATFGRGIWQTDLNTPGTSPPVADFTANRTNICTGDCINFTDLSAGAPTSWAWTFTGGTPSTSTLQNPATICYNTPGTYQVQLIATNANGSNTMTKTAYITVSSPIALPLVEGFQTATFPPTGGWYLNNPDADMTWALSTAAGGFGTSTQSAVMDNLTPATSIAGTVDELWTPKYNFTGVATSTMTFDVAYCRYDATYFDSLIVYVSTNCGISWSRVYAKGGTSLATAPDNNASVFVPTAAQWRTETVSLTPYAGMANVMVKFQNKSGWGQMLYLDNINITGTGAPVASVAIAQTTGTNPMCSGASSTFTATPTNGGATPVYQWQVNGVNVGTNSPTYTTTTLNNGDVVTCIMTSSLGGVVGSPATSNSITMTVNPTPATPTASNTGPYCVGGTISLSTPTVAGATYSWTGPGAYTSTLQNPTRSGATLAMAGTYSVTVTNAAGCTSAAGTTTVVVNAVPATPTASNTGPYCAGATITLSTPTVAGATYSWTGPSAFSSTLQNPTRPTSTVAMSGTYSVTVTVSGCASAAGTTAVVVNATPATPTAANSGPYCSGATISLTTPTVAGATYAWSGPAGYTSTLQNPTIASATTAMAGTYSVTVSVGGCASAAGTTAVVVNAVPATPAASNTGPYCSGATISLSTPTVAGATYAWSGPGAYTSALQNPTIASSTTAMAGTYSVTVIVGGCASAAGTTAVVVNATPATPTASNTGPYCVGSTISLSTPTVAGATYSWTGPGAFTSALQNPTRPSATVAMSGTYSITVTVGGCTSAAGTTAVVVSAVPATPAASNTGPYCSGATISLSTPTVAGATYAWSGPAGYTSAVQNPTIASSTTAMAGTYSVTVTVGGCASAAGTTAVVVNATPATPTASNTGPYCVGQTISLATPTVAGATYSWTGPSAFSSTLQNPTRPSATVVMAGTYSITVTVGGCTSIAGTTSVIVSPAPTTPTAGSNTPVCTGNNILLTANTVAGATYSWTGPGGFTSSIEDPIISGATAGMAGTYSVTITVGSCTSPMATTTVVVNPTPATPTAANTGPYCAGTTIILSTPTVAGATYAWSGPGGYTSALQNPTRPASTVAMSGTYSVTVTVGGCTSAPATTAVVVNALPATPTASNTGPYCTGGTISLSTPTVAGATYSWTGPSAFSSTLQNPTRPSATTAMAGTYSVTITVGGCTSAAGTTAVVVNTTPATPVPSANASTTPAPICAGGTITLTTPSAGGGFTYSWTGPNSYAAAVRNPPALTAVTTAASGTYSLTVTSPAGCTSAAGTVTIIVNAIPATPAPSNTGPYCVGQTISLSTPTVAGATYAWTGPGGFTSALQNPTRPSATLAMSGTYSVTVTVSGCTSAAGTTAVVVNTSVTPSVTVAASPTGPICAGTNVTFTATPSGGGTTPSYQWQVNGSNVGTGGATYSSSALANGDIVTVIMTSASPCASPATATSAGITMTVNPVVTPSVSVSASPSGAICAGTAVTFTATPTNGGAAPIYQWQVNGSNVGTGGTAYTSSSLANGDIVTCILTSNAPCASPATATSAGITMTVNSVVLPSVTIMVMPNDTVCSGDSVAFTSTVVNGGTSPTYQWMVNSAFSCTTPGCTLTSLANGDVVTCIVTSSDACASPVTATSPGITMTVNPTPATPTITVAGDTLISSSATGNQWYLNGVLIAGATSQNYIYTANGTYTVVVTNGSCSSSASGGQVVVNTGLADANNAFSLSVYPNPNDGNFEIHFNVPVKANYIVELTNTLGQLIYKEELSDFSGKFTKKLSVTEYGKGVYNLMLMNDKNEVVKKIIVY
ncbi:MAG: PKD domain-containing protein [Bacteroidia bacterium]